MIRYALQSIRMLAVATVLFGIAYPILIYELAEFIFPGQANGSLIIENGRIVGSKLIGQEFSDPRYFWSRPSATLPYPYNAAASMGANKGPSAPSELAEIRARARALRADPAISDDAPIPVDLLTRSASGLDPHISPDAARYQIPRVAAQRGLDSSVVRALVEEHIEPRWLGIIGEPVVNVLELNLALDRMNARG